MIQLVVIYSPPGFLYLLRVIQVGGWNINHLAINKGCFKNKYAPLGRHFFYEPHNPSNLIFFLPHHQQIYVLNFYINPCNTILDQPTYVTDRFALK